MARVSVFMMGFGNAPLMVLCTRCGAAITTDDGCPTCGDPRPMATGERPEPSIDEALLGRIGEALAAQAALAQRTAAARIARAEDLRLQHLVLRARLQTQRMLLRSSRRSGRRVAPQVADALERVERALRQPQPRGLAGRDWRFSVRLPRDVSCAAVARRLLRYCLSDEAEGDASADVMLVATEIVTNAYRHGLGTISLGARRSADRIRLDVADEGSPEQIRIGLRDNAATGGRGLDLIDRIALRWGVVPGTAHVWVELPFR